MNTSKPRFQAPKVYDATGNRGPSATRLGQSASGFRFESDSQLAKNLLERKNSKQKKDKEFEDLNPELLNAAHGLLCFQCGGKTVESGNGCRKCTVCSCLVLKGGHSSSASAEKSSSSAINLSRAGSKQSMGSRQGSKASMSGGQSLMDVAAAMMEANGPQALGSSFNRVAAGKAWRRLSVEGHHDMAVATGLFKGETNVSDPHSELIPIVGPMGETGFFVGDRVKSNMRLPGACPGGLGWDPINPQTNEGTITGEGGKFGEIMVKFDASGTECSMKVAHLTKCKYKDPTTNIDRSRCRQTHMTRGVTL